MYIWIRDTGIVGETLSCLGHLLTYFFPTYLPCIPCHGSGVDLPCHAMPCPGRHAFGLNGLDGLSWLDLS